MRLEAGKKYKLRNGTVEKCLAVWCEEVDGYQATVTFQNGGTTCFTIDGFCYQDKRESPHDIIAECREPRKCEAWVNLYNDGTLSVWESKELADEDTTRGRIECRKIEWEVPDNG